MVVPLEIRVVTHMARQAFFLHLFRCRRSEAKYLGRFAAALDVIFGGPVAVFARHPFTAMLESQLGVGIL
jgi:hypothetical protein